MKLRLISLSLIFPIAISLIWLTQATSDTPVCIDAKSVSSTPLYSLSEPTTTTLVHESTYRDYIARSYLVTEHLHSERGIATFEIWKDGHLACRQTSATFDAPRYGFYETKDYTGNGIPDLIVGDCEQAGRSRCWLHVFELGATLRYITTAYIPLGGIEFVDLDHDSIPELVVHDVTFGYWKLPFGGSYFPKVILHFEDGAYHLASDLMRQPAPSEIELARHAQEVQRSPEWKYLNCPPEFLRYMLDLIYTGHADLAWQFFDMAWPPEEKGKNQFLAEFVAELATSQYWPELRKMNNMDVYGYLQDPN
jgi:hypothetical protein